MRPPQLGGALLGAHRRSTSLGDARTRGRAARPAARLAREDVAPHRRGGRHAGAARRRAGRTASRRRRRRSPRSAPSSARRVQHRRRVGLVPRRCPRPVTITSNSAAEPQCVRCRARRVAHLGRDDAERVPAPRAGRRSISGTPSDSGRSRSACGALVVVDGRRRTARPRGPRRGSRICSRSGVPIAGQQHVVVGHGAEHASGWRGGTRPGSARSESTSVPSKSNSHVLRRHRAIGPTRDSPHPRTAANRSSYAVIWA